MRRPAILFGMMAAVASAALPVAASAGTLRVTPVRVEIAPGKQFCALTIANDGDRPVSVQVRGFGWSNDAEGGEVLDPAHGPVLNPGIATLKQGEARLIRCSVPAPAAPSIREESWRLLVDELPAPASAIVPGTVQALLRLSVPVFRTPAGAAPALRWSLVDGALLLENTGSAHARIVALDLRTAAGTARLPRALYLLAGSRARIALPAGTPPTTVEAETPEGILAATPASPRAAGN